METKNTQCELSNVTSATLKLQIDEKKNLCARKLKHTSTGSILINSN